jgi:hypothetical protein
MGIEYPWYDVVDGIEQLLQGDFILACPVVVPPQALSAALEPSMEVTIKVSKYDVVILSQSCDLVEGKVDLVLVCPFWSLDDFGRHDPTFTSNRGKEVLRRGNATGYHMLDKCAIKGYEHDFLVVSFRSAYAVPYEFSVELARQRGKRLRLLPPYREHLSQAFARFLMRVGLPVDIPPFE